MDGERESSSLGVAITKFATRWHAELNLTRKKLVQSFLLTTRKKRKSDDPVTFVVRTPRYGVTTRKWKL